jgi:hypothetical protein
MGRPLWISQLWGVVCESLSYGASSVELSVMERPLWISQLWGVLCGSLSCQLQFAVIISQQFATLHGSNVRQAVTHGRP